MITKKMVKNIIGRRNREIHKGDCGRVLIVAGSVGMAGAAVLCARGALRSGAGLVQVSIPQELFPIVQTGVIEATCLNRTFSNIDLGNYDAVAMGPGLGKGEESVLAVKTILKEYDGPLVVDADGLNIIVQEDLFEEIRNRKGYTIITPHIGEALRLLNANKEAYMMENNSLDRMKIAEDLAIKTGKTVILKGNETIACQVVPTGEVKSYTNTTGNPGMATAGSGDVLTGVIAGIWKQSFLKLSADSNVEKEEIALLISMASVYFHGLAGDLAKEDFGEAGLIASDIANYVGKAIKLTIEES